MTQKFQYTPITTANQNTLNQLAQYKLNIDTASGKQSISSYDLQIFLNKYIGLLGFTGQTSVTSFTWPTVATNYLIATWNTIPKSGSTPIPAEFQNTFYIKIGYPSTSSTTNTGDYCAKLIVNARNNTGGASPYALSMTIQNACGSGNFPATDLNIFSLAYYASDGHLELGVIYEGVAGAVLPSSLCVYCEPPTIWDSGNPNGLDGGTQLATGSAPSAIPVLNTTSGQQMTTISTQAIAISINDGGSNFYSWATTSSSGGNVTTGFV